MSGSGPGSGATPISRVEVMRDFGMPKALPVSDLREQVKVFKILVVVIAALLGLAPVELLWTWLSRPDLAKRDIVMINAFFGVGLATNVLLFRRFTRYRDPLVGLDHS